jgi:DNA-binding response OmpR family regulator
MPTILLTDDDTMLREMLATALAEAGHTVVQARDGKQATSLFRAQPADLVITDLIMPDGEGLESIAALHREWPEVPIIAISGVSPYSPLYLDLASKLGARRTLYKPFQIAELLGAIDDLLAPPGPPPLK